MGQHDHPDDHRETEISTAARVKRLEERMERLEIVGESIESILRTIAGQNRRILGNQEKMMSDIETLASNLADVKNEVVKLNADWDALPSIEQLQADLLTATTRINELVAQNDVTEEAKQALATELEGLNSRVAELVGGSAEIKTSLEGLDAKIPDRPAAPGGDGGSGGGTGG